MNLLTPEQVFAKAEDRLFSSIRESGTVLAGDIFKHGTTDLALVYQGGVLIATDGRATSSTLSIATESFQKIVELDSHSALALAGMPALGIPIAEFLRAQFSFMENDNEGVYIPPESKVNAIAQNVRKNLGLLLAHKLVVEFILATFDSSSSNPRGRVFKIWPEGTIEPETDYVAIGSGGQIAGVVLDVMLGAALKKNARELALDEAKDLAVMALIQSHKADAGTGKCIFMRSIDKDGISVVGKDEINKIIEKNKIEGVAS